MKSDGWNLEDLECLLDTVYELTYEVKNCIRGAYTNCTTYAELGEYIQDLGRRMIEEGECIAEMPEEEEDEE